MSLYIEWLNQIKMNADVNWLTKSQASVYSTLLSSWLNQQFVNLFGPQGSGKSFIARLLVSKQNYIYSTDLQSVPQGSVNVVCDNVSYYRSLRNVARERSLGRIIIITDKPVNEAMPKCELKLTESDVRQFVTTLAKYCKIYFTHSIPEGTDLNQLLLQELINRGEEHHANS